MNNDILKVLYSKEEIEAACQRLGKDISKTYAGKTPVVVGVLKGAIFFMTDIVRAVDTYMQIDFIDVSSYHGATQSSGTVELLQDINTDISGRDVLIVEDIVDTGQTLKFLLDTFANRGASSIKVCTLLDKPAGRTVKVSSDFIGFKVPNEFVVGYGLDYDERYRNLPYIGVLKPEIYANN
ncbi:hypoxanthine phosphoribosyltransferase [Lentilactobacillus otakiensis]|uniref:Hypoxanthine phosphoribosyltransferase n=1 Tax=Lentilactobacillus otakiensis DSM 19908 = JCM 15040 TaxID=1423780 RepID=S4NUB6_9LACO|nr:hypoxanthine phosphoribosyltransferase [Lentilactobacillus otakiensis]KRL11802.1 hypoxanthine phosphoribosyltransferase [Lentilactobacillus otakiensis DSM 19908 = JCM 15040]MBZ3776077.1 hypoxanthine phosphoribosyltransferase [Lentilactobacillus otakiensis]MDV3519142.1 hypoxanthine phosphoribosyltransferase [Lentilactobacillus otakiensis]GAD17553.1 hypoxanthine phosphoribosyltransferase [Lentilactobacillus otakiensis DSM 19908 = JCM 15040]